MTSERTAGPPMSDEAIRRGTGRGWDEWVALLDAWGADVRSHADIAAHVLAEHGVAGWWAQAVTVGYERIKGRRAVGQVAGGTFAGSASKTFPVPAARLFRAWTDAAERERWLPAGTLTLRTAREGRSARFDLAGGGMLALWLTDKSAKSAVQVQHEGLPSKAAADAFRAVWKDHLGRLADHLDTT